MQPQFVSLIHGVRRLHRLRPYTRWMDDFRDYLIGKGVASVSCFCWNGAIVRGFAGIDASRYADDLLRNYRCARDAGGSLSIVSKSAGGLIAEKALHLLNGDVRIDLFLRIGVPDVRAKVPIDNVDRVANVTSLRDKLFRFGKLAAPYFVNKRIVGADIPTVNIELRTLTHRALSECTCLSEEGIADPTTYDLYWRLLNDNPSS